MIKVRIVDEGEHHLAEPRELGVIAIDTHGRGEHTRKYQVTAVSDELDAVTREVTHRLDDGWPALVRAAVVAVDRPLRILMTKDGA